MTVVSRFGTIYNVYSAFLYLSFPDEVGECDSGDVYYMLAVEYLDGYDHSPRVNKALWGTNDLDKARKVLLDLWQSIKNGESKWEVPVWV